MLKDHTVLAIDDDEEVLIALRLLLRKHAKNVVTERHPDRLPALLAQHKPGLVLLDMNYRSTLHTGNEGLFWLAKVRELAPQARVIMITAFGEISLAVKSLKEGAADFVLKPFQNDKLLEALEAAAEGLDQARKVKEPVPSGGGQVSFDDFTLIGRSQAMREVLYKIDKVAPTDANVLILGENGTGKELIARALHHRSRRAAKPFVHVDVGALSETLFESELFGHKKGAFTDAREDRPGRMEAAHHGTLFLDEIGNISARQQSKLLVALQSRQVTRLGSNVATPVDIRLISATNMPIYEMAERSEFRTDLIYRINTVELQIPPLRDRPEDIEELSHYFIKRYAQKYGKAVPGIEPAAMARLKAHYWPGNVRELQNTIERTVIMADAPQLRAHDFNLTHGQQHSRGPALSPQDETSLRELERNTIIKVIEKNSGNLSKAARELGITRAALYRRMEKYDI